MSGFTWVPFYMEFAGKLLTYQFDRPAMVQKVIKAYAQAELKMPRLDSTDIPVDMDPFTVLGLFNKNMKDESGRFTRAGR